MLTKEISRFPEMYNGTFLKSMVMLMGILKSTYLCESCARDNKGWMDSLPLNEKSPAYDTL